MKKLTQTLALVLVALLMTSTFAACSGSSSSSAAAEPAAETSAAEPADSVAADSTAADASTADSAAGESTGGLHEIYTVTERNNLSGLISPDLADRSGIEKALPEAGASSEGLKIGYSMGQMGSPFFTAMVDGAQAKCDEYGWELIVTNADGNISTQSADVESLVTQGVDVILLNPMDVTAAASDVKRCVEEGIPVIGVGVDFAPDVPVITSYLANNFFGGWETGLFLGDFFDGEHIKAAGLLGMMGHTIDESRLTGMLAGIAFKRKELAGEPYDVVEDAYMAGYEMFNELRSAGSMSSDEFDLEVVACGEGLWTNEGGMTAMEDIIVAHPDINLVMAGCDPMGAGAIKAIEATGLVCGEDVYVACPADGGDEMFALLDNGKMLVTGYNSPHLNGAGPLELLYAIYEEGFDASNLPAATDLPTGAITKDNWKDYDDPDSEYCIPLPVTVKSIPEIRAENGL